MKMLNFILFGLLISSCLCDGYRILAVFPTPSPSHGILGDSFVKALLNAGHEVVYISPFKKINHAKLEIIDVSQNLEVFSDKNIDVKAIMTGSLNLQDPKFLFGMTTTMTDVTLANPNVQKLLRDPKQKFDVIVAEYFFNNIFSTLSAVYDAPFIWFLTIVPHSLILDQIHGPMNPAYSSDYIEARIAPYSFVERVRELYFTLTLLYNLHVAFPPIEEAIYHKHISTILKSLGKPIPDYNALTYNVSMVLGNSQVALESAVPLPPNFKHIGGYHIDDDVKPLPENLKKIFDNAKNGVVYFSLGSNLKSKDLPEDMKQGILKVLGELKQTVIWKFEESFPNTPKNVHIVQWAPQQSILAEPNLVLFVTHGGFLSVTEAVHFGVPLVVIPVFGDQFMNANLVVKKGIAVQVKLSYTMHNELKVAMDTVLGDSKYATNAKALSAAFHDLEMKPKDALNFWVEHVVRTRGAPHLRSVAIDIPLYQRMYLDLLALILLTPAVLLLVLRRFCCKSDSQKVKRS
ncbi:UDP-glucosyltransferase 2-like [Helicoverpa armigera]|uniref:UDP-glucosyltransferase 2-like n=1 Tax=Helicoverpa armigera TaxID=29058 RepID=UPI0030830537